MMNSKPNEVFYEYSRFYKCVDAQKQPTLAVSIIESPDHSVDDLWAFDFSQVERYLSDSLNAAQRLFFHRCEMTGIFDTTMPRLLRTHSFFWSLERYFPHDGSVLSTEQDFYKACSHVRNMLEEFHSQKFFPHYFIPEVNLFDVFDKRAGYLHHDLIHSRDFDGSEKEKDSESVESEQAFDFWDQLEFSPVRDGIRSELLYLVVRNLRKQFVESIELMLMVLHHRLHATLSIDESIKWHAVILRRLNEIAPLSRYEKSLRLLQLWLKSSLGIIYHVKAAEHSIRNGEVLGIEQPESVDCLHLAEEYLASAASAESLLSLSCIVNHVVIYLSEQRSHEAIDTLQARFENERIRICMDWNSDDNMGAMEGLTEKDFEDDLQSSFARWIHDRAPVMFCHLITPVLPKELISAMPLSIAQSLGILNLFSTSCLDAQFVMHYLLARCFIDVGKVDDALAVLERIEAKDMLTPQPGELNDRVFVVYLNLMAGAYRRLGKASEVKRMFSRSRDYLRNARNPAGVVLLTSMVAATARKLLKLGLACAALIGIASWTIVSIT